jgi:hypothetical protein
MRTDFTDYEAAVIFATAARCGIEYAPSDQLKRERPDCPWLEPAIRRHGPDSVEAKWYDFRSHLLPDHTPKRGVSRQVERIARELDWVRTSPSTPFPNVLARLARRYADH